MTTEEDEAYKRNQAEAYCNHIRGLRHRKDVAEMDVAEAEQTLDGLGAVRYDREGGKTYVAHGDDKMAAVVEQLADRRKRLTDELLRYTMEADQFDALCNRLTPLYSKVLKLRYRHAMKWDDVADAIPVSPGYARGALHNKALEELYSVMPMSWK